MFFGRGYAGTNDDNSIYIADEGEKKGFTVVFLEATMHSEYFNILIDKCNFPLEKWRKINGADWKYLGYGRDFDILDRSDLHAHSHKLLSIGFLDKYVQASEYEDINVSLRDLKSLAF